MYYLDKIKKHCPVFVAGDDLDKAVPHQSISPREILASWVRNDVDTDIHEPVDDWHGGDNHPNSIREFEDDFEAMEYISSLSNQPVTLDNVGNVVSEETPDDSSGPESSGDN